MPRQGRFDAKLKLELVACDSHQPFADSVDFRDLLGTCCFNSKVDAHVGTTAGSAEHHEICMDVAKDCSRRPRLISLRPVSARVDEEKERKPDSTDTTIEFVPGKWVDIDATKISRDQLAYALTFTANAPPAPASTPQPGAGDRTGGGTEKMPAAPHQQGHGRTTPPPPPTPAPPPDQQDPAPQPTPTALHLGRPQFYFDGLIELLLGSSGATNSRLKLEFSLVPLYWDETSIANGTVFTKDDGKELLSADGIPFTDNQGTVKHPLKRLGSVIVQCLVAYGD